ncbi:MAG: PKD domain-containing protein [Lewinellaceae bacterium]|nr:PKD domain-containing protein [Saprospiraceae bacterium]MCB9313948.1 PKD domain-containing protein [Lewinellaceae bacterium]
MRSLLLITLAMLLLTPLHAQLSINGPDQVCGGCQTYWINGQGSQVATGWEFTQSGIVLFKDTINPFVICFDSLAYGVYDILATSNNGSVVKKTIYYYPPQEIFLFSLGGAYCPNSNTNCEEVCEGTEVTYSVEVPSQDPITFSVSGGTIVQQNGNEVTIIWSEPGQGFLDAFSQDPCLIPTTICINILAVPDAEIHVDGLPAPDTLEVCRGQEVALEDASQPAANTSWRLSDGRLFEEKNPRVTFDQTGDVTVLLVAQSGCNCADTARMVVRVLPESVPDLDCTGTVCPGERVTYTTSPGCSYTWVVSPEGTILSGGTPADNEVTVVWQSGPEGTISLLATGCGAVCSEPAEVRIPILDGSAPIEGPASVCKGSEVTYSIIPYHGTDYVWTVSAGAKITAGQGSNQVQVEWPNTSFWNDGWVKVEYTNCSQGCSGSAQLDVVLTTSFHVAGPLKGCLQETMTFDAKKGLTPIACNWTVLDAQGNTVQTGVGTTTSFTYSAIHGSGPFTVVASQPDPNLTCNETYRWAFQILDPLPLVDSITGPEWICPGDAYTYIGHSSHPLYDLEWTIRNGAQMDVKVLDQTVVTWNATSGPYELALRHRLRYQPGCVSDPVVMVAQPVSGLLIAGDVDACLGAVTTYSLTPDVTALDVEWTIQPSTAGVIRPGMLAGTADIQWLSPVNAVVQASVCGAMAQLPVEVHDRPQPTINAPAGVCQGEQTSVSVQEAYNQYGWYNESNSLVSSSATPDLSPGTWLLGVEDGFGCRDTVSLTIVEWPLPEITLSSPDPHGFCPAMGEPAPTLYALSDDGGYQVSWYLDNNFILWAKGQSAVGSQFGTYQVVATDQNGCTNTSNEVLVFEFCSADQVCTGNCTCTKIPCPELSLAITPGAYCNERGYEAVSSGPAISNPLWRVYDIAQAVPVEFTTSTINYTYSKAGYYTLYFGADLGGKFCDAAFIDTIPVSADFFAVAACEGQVMSFTDRSTWLPNYTITGWSWDFGDPASGAANFSSDQHPDHLYAAPGWYTVTLTIQSSTGCDSRMTRQVEVRPNPVLSVSGPTDVCELTDGVWQGGSPNRIVDWAWDFDDPASGAANQVDVRSALHIFSGPGNKVLTLAGTDEYGCSQQITFPVTVHANTLAGTIQYTSPLCEGTQTTLHFDGAGTTFIWSSGATGNDPLVDEAGAYALTVTDNLGCRFEPPAAVVEVLPEPGGLIRAIEKNENGVISAIHYDFLKTCFGDPVFLDMELQGVYGVLWSTGSTDKALEYSLERGNPLPVGTHVFTAILTDNATGCTTEIGPMTVEVNANPGVPQIAFDGTPPWCALSGEVARVKNIQPGMTYTWSTQQQGTFITVQSAGLYSVQVRDMNGCTAESYPLTLQETPSTLLAPDGCHRGCKPDTLCIGTPSWLASWQWTYNGSPVPAPGGQSAVLPIQQSGSYALQLVHSNGCAADSEPFYMELFDGISQFDGQVWFDVNDNGIIDGPDTLVSNVLITLSDVTGQTTQVMSDPNGTYVIPGVPGLGIFYLSVDMATLPPSWTPVWADSILVVNTCDQLLSTDILLRFSCQTVNTATTFRVCPNEKLVYAGDSLEIGDIKSYSFQTSQGCDSLVEVTVAAFPDVAVQLLVDSACVGQSTGQLTIVPSPANSSPLTYSLDGVSWQPGAMFSDLATGQVTVYIQDTNSCVRQVDIGIPERPAVPDHTWMLDIDTTCLGQADGSLTILPLDLPGGPVEFSLDGQVWQSDPFFDGLSSGLQTVYMRDSQDCQRLVQAIVPSYPVLDFSLPQVSLPCEEGGVVLKPLWISGQSTVLGQTWSTGETTDQIEVWKTGQVSLTVDGICEQQTRTISVDYAPEVAKPDRFFFVPSVFSPDANGINDLFRPLPAEGLQVVDYHFEVFDRWGNKIFMTDDQQAGWDGRLREEELDQEVFVWWLEARIRFCQEDVIIRQQGDVTLVLR